MDGSDKQLVIVDDSSVMLMTFEALVKDLRCQVFLSASFDSARSFCLENKTDVLISDLHIGPYSGFDIIAAANSNAVNRSLKSFICSAESPEGYKQAMIDHAVCGWIVKPVNHLAFKTALQTVLAGG